MNPVVSVLVVNWNTRELLRCCLESLLGAEESGYVQVILVDNASSDGSVEVARSFGDAVEVVANDRNLGFSAATNQAYERATAPYCLMLNSDTVVPAGTIRACVERMARSDDIAGVGCRLLNPDGSHQSSIFRFPSLRGVVSTVLYVSQAFPTTSALNWDRYGDGHVDAEIEVDVVMGSFLLVDREYLEPGPLLDEGYFMYGEETDLCRRLRARGGRVVFTPEQAITHLHGASSKSPEQVAWSELAKRRGVLRFLRRWRRRGVAELANLVLLIGLGPRWIVWSLADTLDRLRGRPSARRRLKAGAARFHLHAVVRPSAMDEPWGPPPAPVS